MCYNIFIKLKVVKNMDWLNFHKKWNRAIKKVENENIKKKELATKAKNKKQNKKKRDSNKG